MMSNTLPMRAKVAPTFDAPGQPLSQRELEVLAALALGQTNHAIADTLIISEQTVRTHLKNIFRKLGVNNRAAAITTALRHQLITL